MFEWFEVVLDDVLYCFGKSPTMFVFSGFCLEDIFNMYPLNNTVLISAVYSTIYQYTWEVKVLQCNK